MKNNCLLLFIFLTVFATHFMSTVITITDSRWVLPLSMSLLKEHNTSLDEYTPQIVAQQNYGVEQVNGHYYYFLPVGTSVMIAPFLEVLKFVAHKVFYFDLEGAIANNYAGGVESFLACLLVSFAALFVFLISWKQTDNKALSLFAVFVFAYCSSVWSTASRALWSHTPTILLLSIALYFLLRAKENSRWLFVVALALAYSYVVRPTNSLVVVFFSLYVLINYTKQLPIYITGLLVIFVPFVLYNYHIYHQPLSHYYLPSTLQVGRSPYLSEALAGTLISPNRGLFVFSSVFIFSMVGVLIRVIQKKFTHLDAAILAIILAHYYLISSITTPYGGYSYGPRYFTDMVPFFVYFLVYFLQYLFEMKRGVAQFALAFLFLITTILSFSIHYVGANHPAAFDAWNRVGNVEDHHERVWDWNDLQFLR